MPYKCTFAPSAVSVSLPLYTSRRALSLKYFSLFARYSSISSWDGSSMQIPSHPSTTAVIPSETMSTIPSTLSTAGISSALARIAEWDVLPPTAVMIPATFSLTIPAVMDGVRSSATRIVPAGTSDMFTSGVPVSILSILTLMSPISVALCLVSSSSAIWNIPANISHVLSNAASAQVPLIIAPFVISSIPGSVRSSMCPSRISALCSPTLSFMASAMACVFSVNAATASSYLLISASVSVIVLFSYSGFASDMITTFPTP